MAPRRNSVRAATVGIVEIILLGLGVGLCVGLMGVGGGVVLVPALVYFAQMTQHMAQGTSLLIQLPPVGIGALYLYWKKGHVEWRAGIVCAIGFLLGGWFGSLFAVRLASQDLRALFGLFLMIAATVLIQQTLEPHWWRRRRG
jgi:uncharacterized membrane protein YfcA